MRKATFLMAMLAGFSGCALEPQRNPEDGTFRDPLEKINRPIFKFNMALDRHIFRPIAHFYDDHLSSGVKNGISHIIKNLELTTTIANDVLQADLAQGLADTGRFLINSTVGVLGWFDVATHANLRDHQQDLGLTFAKWGVRESPFFMVPVLGPKTIRDTIAWPIQYRYLPPWEDIHSLYLRYSLLGLKYVSERVALLPTDKFVDQAFDPYVFVRDAYLQKRTKEVDQLSHTLDKYRAAPKRPGKAPSAPPPIEDLGDIATP